MAYIKEYWVNKEDRAEQARKHTDKMEKDYSDKIKESVRDTIYYLPGFECTKTVIKENAAKIIVDDIDSVSAIFKYSQPNSNGKIAVLNFSSYKNPGGMFINGSKAQEECLCHESFLYNVLSQKLDFYDWNIKHKNKALYLNRALYSPNILFMRGHKEGWNDVDYYEQYCDVITCAAPNKSSAQKYQNVSDEENSKALRSRIKFVLDIAKDNNVETLILGAYGCGVFGQNPKEVASIFKKYLNTTHICFDKVAFAIPKGKGGNLEAFRDVFGCR